MVYKVIGLMSGSSLDGLDIAYVHLQESVSSSKDAPRKWEYTFLHTACYHYTKEWKDRLAGATGLSALDYQLLHAEYGHYIGQEVLRFIDEHSLHYQVQLIASHGHTTFHLPAQKMTAQLGDGAAIAATTGINVVSDLRAMDLALGGQGAPIVPVGEKLLLSGYQLFLNLGGIANLSRASDGNEPYIAFDVCPANRVLNGLAVLAGKDYDEDGALAAKGKVDAALLERLNGLEYYGKGYPKSLGNTMGTETVLPMIREAMGSVEDALRTYVEHIAVQIGRAVEGLLPAGGAGSDAEGPEKVVGARVGGTRPGAGIAEAGREGVQTAAAVSGEVAVSGSASGAGGRGKMLVTGGGAHNVFLTDRLREILQPLGVDLDVPVSQLVDYKEALVMALIGVLRWREENNVLASVTGASRDSIGGAVWMGQEA